MDAWKASNLWNIKIKQKSIIHLVRTQNLLKNYYFLPADTHTNGQTHASNSSAVVADELFECV